MKFLSVPEFQVLAEQHSLDKKSLSLNYLTSFGHEDQRWRCIVLAREMVGWFGDYEQCLVRISEWGVWPSSEDGNLYTRFRSSFGESSLLRDKPCHVFFREDVNDLTSFINLFLQFGWDARFHCQSPSQYIEIFISHDGYVNIHSGHRMLQVERSLHWLKIPFEVVELKK